MTEKNRQTITVQADGRATITGPIRKAVQIDGKKAYCKVDRYGDDKFLLTILHRCGSYETLEIREDGRITLPLNKKGKKAFCQVENIGPGKILLTILTRWTPNNRSPFKDMVKKQ